jgi:hypothetical protein
MAELLNCSLNASAIARELYDPKKKGVCSIPEFLGESLREAVVAELKANSDLFKIVEPEYRKVQPELEKFAVYDNNVFHMVNFLAFNSLLALYVQMEFWYRWIGNHASFYENANSFVIQRVKQGLSGIAPHRDFSSSRNLIEIVVLEGEAPFFVCNPDGSDRLELPSEPGSLILLRGPRNERENVLRPYHGVGETKSDRYTALLRFQGEGSR